MAWTDRMQTMRLTVYVTILACALISFMMVISARDACAEIPNNQNICNLRAPDTEPNNDFANATPVTFTNNNATIFGTLDETTDPDDYFVLTVPSGLGFTATLNITLETNDFDLYIFNSTEYNVDYSASENSIETAAARSDGQPFYVYVTSYYGSGSYQLLLSIVTPPPSDGNDEIETAQLVSNQQTVNSTLDRYFDKEDWYKINLDANESVCDLLYVNLTCNEDADYDLLLLDLWGNDYSFEINSSMTENQTERVCGAASYAGYYYIGVLWYSGSGNYSITFEVGKHQSDGNNIFANASKQELPCTVTGSVNQVYDIYDWYSFELTANETRIDSVMVNLTVFATDYTFFSIMLLDPDFRNLDYWLTNESVEIFGSATTSGTYYVVVIAYGNYWSDGEIFIPLGGAASGNYQLKIEKTTEYLDGNDLPVNATRIYPGETHATVGIPRDFIDWYYIEVRANSTVYVNLTLPQNADFDLYIYGEEVVYDSVAPLDKSETAAFGGLESVDCQVQTNCRIYICVRAFEDFGGGEYVLSVNVVWRNTPPSLNATPKGEQYMLEGETLTFRIDAIDPDNETGSFSYLWTFDGIQVGGNENTFTYISNTSSAGVHALRVVVTDSDGASASYQWNITVNQTNHLPVITNTFPISLQFEMNENSSVEFRVNATDSDIPDGDVLRFYWYVNDELQDLELQKRNFTFAVDYNSAGEYTISVIVKDSSNAFVTHKWNVTVKNVNRAPIIKGIEPSPPSEELRYSDTVGLAFTVHCQDPDGDELTITWKEGGITLGQRSVLIQKFSVGHHTITAYVSDGKDTTEQSISFEITKTEQKNTDSKTITYLLALVTIVIVLAIIFIVAKGMRRPKVVSQPNQPNPPSQPSQPQPSFSQGLQQGQPTNRIMQDMQYGMYREQVEPQPTTQPNEGMPIEQIEQPEITLPKAEKPISLRKKKD